MNLVILNGRLTRDPELRQIPSGTDVAEFGVAVDVGFGDKKETCFVDVVAWAHSAKFVTQWFHKGDGIVIQGKLKMDTWEDKNGGGKRSKHKVVADQLSFPVGSSKSGKKPETTDTPPSTPESGWNAKEEISEIPF